MTGQTGHGLAATPMVRLRSRLPIVVGGLIALYLASAAWSVWQGYRQEQVHAATQIRNLVRVLEEHAVRILGETDREILETIEDVAGLVGVWPQSDPVLSHGLRERFQFLPQVQAAAIIDRDGVEIAGFRRGVTVPLNGTERSHFAIHRDQTGAGLFVSRPSLIGDEREVVLSRRLSAPDGSFGGVVAAALNVAYFTNLYRSINVGRQGVITLVGDDGYIRYRLPPLPQVNPTRAAARVLERSREATAGEFHATSPIDGVVRYYAYRKLAALPLTVIFGLGEDDILERWWSETKRTAFGAFGVVVVVLGLTVLVLHHVRLSEDTFAALRASEIDHRAIIETATEGYWELDREARTTSVNEALCRMLGYTREEILARRPDEFATLVHRQDYADQLSARSRRINRSYEQELRTKTGSVICVRISATSRFDAQGQLTGSFAFVSDITVEKQLAREMADQQERLQRILTAVPVALVITRAEDGCVLHANPEATELFGVDQVKGPIAQKAPDFYANPADRIRFTEAVRRDTVVKSFEVRLKRSDGLLWWGLLSARLFPFQDTLAMLVAIQDITHLKRTEQALRESRERVESQARFLETLINATPVPVFVKDAEGRYLRCNRAFAELLGLAQGEILGKTIFDLARPDKAILHHHTDQSLLAGGGEITYETVMRRGNGSEATMFIHKAAFSMPEGAGIIGLMLDITERKSYEAGVEQARKAAEEANRAKSVFLATMSHELRTPLNAILGFSELIRDQAFGPVGVGRYVEYANDIYAAGEHLLTIVTDILDLAKIEAGRMEIDAQDLDAGVLVASVLRLVADHAQRSGITVANQMPPSGFGMWGDERAVKQVMFNLLSNAIKFSHPGDVVTVCARSHSSLNGEGPGTVDLVVADTGCGIPGDRIDHIFRPFEQVDNRFTRARGGSGLGLSLVKGLVELHGGWVTIESTVGVGTTVTVTMPGRPQGGMNEGLSG